jgi:hypothetical protein
VSPFGATGLAFATRCVENGAGTRVMNHCLGSLNLHRFQNSRSGSDYHRAGSDLPSLVRSIPSSATDFDFYGSDNDRRPSDLDCRLGEFNGGPTHLDLSTGE